MKLPKIAIIIFSFLLMPVHAVLAGANGKLSLFGGVQENPVTFGGAFGTWPWPDPLWKAISAGQAKGAQWPFNWYRDDYSLACYVWMNGKQNTSDFQKALHTLKHYLVASNANGPCLILYYPGSDYATLAQYKQWLQIIAPYIRPGTYEIAANEINGGSTEPNKGLLNELGGPGATGWDGIINLIKLQRQYLPGARLGLNDYNICCQSIPNSGYFNQAQCIKNYKTFHDNGAALDWLGIEGYHENYSPTGPAPNSINSIQNAVNTVGAAIKPYVTGNSPNGFMAFTEFTPDSFSSEGWNNNHPTQTAVWQAFLPMFAANQYIFGVTGPWSQGMSGHRRSSTTQDPKAGESPPQNWFYNDTNNFIPASQCPDLIDAPAGAILPSLPWVQSWVANNVSSTASPATPTHSASPTPTPAAVN